MRIPISKIRVNPGRRDTRPRNVEELARSLKAVGLINPITVTQDNTLIAGLHRLEAAKLLGWTEIEIECTVSSAEGIQAELAEIDENFVRADLSHRELGDLLLRRKALYEALHPETQQGRRNGQTAKNDNLTRLETKPFSQDTADKMGVSRRTVERLVQTAANLTPEAKAVIRDTDNKITRDAALKISRLPPDQQAKAAESLTALPPAPAPEKDDLESLLKDFKVNANQFLFGMKSFCRQADSFARMSFGQSSELWDSAYAVTEAIREFSKKVNTLKDQKQGENNHEN
ncbi:MAG: ParB N-terminal domain-containing protein, partial [Oscillospiraceae bacterium]|nr:ParB N-terminal domain-containing protein [Oscillospiraceae bacterium]